MKSIKKVLVVERKHCAIEVGSGTLAVFSTPSLAAFMENTAMLAIDDLQEGFTTVGIEINIQHIKASPIGETLTAVAHMTSHEGRAYDFEIEVSDSKGSIVGKATHKRFAVDSQKFMQKLT